MSIPPRAPIPTILAGSPKQSPAQLEDIRQRLAAAWSTSPFPDEAWCAIYERKAAIWCVVPEYDDDADAETIRKATRTAQLRATDRDATGRLRWRGP